MCCLQECIDQWLSSRRPLCPVCKHNALKDSGALTEQVSAAVQSIGTTPQVPLDSILEASCQVIVLLCRLLRELLPLRLKQG